MRGISDLGKRKRNSRVIEAISAMEQGLIDTEVANIFFPNFQWTCHNASIFRIGKSRCIAQQPNFRIPKLAFPFPKLACCFPKLKTDILFSKLPKSMFYISETDFSHSKTAEIPFGSFRAFPKLTGCIPKLKTEFSHSKIAEIDLIHFQN